MGRCEEMWGGVRRCEEVWEGGGDVMRCGGGVRKCGEV